MTSWEVKNSKKCTDNSIKLDILKRLVTSCGLSTSGKSVVKLRVLLQSLRKHDLPLCAKSVTHALVNNYQTKAGGDGLRSPQQRSLRLLELMDPSLAETLGTKRQPIKTGDFVWCETKRMPLSEMISEHLGKWVKIRPPFGYDESQTKDMWFWQVLRETGLTWAKPDDAMDFAIVIYNIYADLFSKVISNSDRWTIDITSSYFSSNVILQRKQRYVRKLQGDWDASSTMMWSFPCKDTISWTLSPL